VDPQRQKAYDLLVMNALDYLSGKGRERVRSRLSNPGQDPMETVGKVAGTIVVGQAMSAQNSGVDLDKGVLFHAMREVVGAVAKVGASMGMEADEQSLNRAYLAAVEELVSKGAQLFTEEDKEGARQYLAENLPEEALRAGQEYVAQQQGPQQSPQQMPQQQAPPQMPQQQMPQQQMPQQAPQQGIIP
jgi:high-affinity Fe2+/Pb2+ permease